MGIRFRCPSCQRKLNIKALQAGKKGVCPKCREALRVPKFSGLDKDGNDLPQEEMDRLAASYSAKSSAQETPAKVGSDSNGQEFQCGQPGTAIQEDHIDPIFEAPDRVWHLRDAQQVESGPISGKKLRKKINAGNVKPGDFVCREDWQDWRSASEAFPELDAGTTAIPRASESVYTNSDYPISEAVTAKAQKAQAKKRITNIQIAMCVVGLLITAALCYLLIRLI
jgi:hypothetical protein